MAAIDARIEQTDARRLVVLSRKARALKQFIRPFALLPDIHFVEKAGGLFRQTQLRDAVQRHHGTRELPLGAVHQQDGALREIGLLLADHAFGQRCQLPEIFDHGLSLPTNGKPDLPPEWHGGVRGQQ